MKYILAILLFPSLALALTPAQRTELKTRVDESKALGIRDTSAILTRLASAPQTGTTTNTVTQAREQWEKQLINGFKTVAQNAGITRADLDDSAIVRTKLATWANGLTAANREAAQVNIIPLFWIAYDRYRSQDPATIDADNVSYQTLTPVYGTPIITFPITGADVEDVQRNP
jgi:hypothetical protein